MSKTKPKNGKSHHQNYTNLLYLDSDSDTVPDLKLPPLKGKKSKRRGSYHSSEETLCTAWMILKVVIVTLILISIAVLGVVSYWSQQQITDLKEQLNIYHIPTYLS